MGIKDELLDIKNQKTRQAVSDDQQRRDKQCQKEIAQAKAVWQALLVKNARSEKPSKTVEISKSNGACVDQNDTCFTCQAHRDFIQGIKDEGLNARFGRRKAGYGEFTYYVEVVMP